MNVFKHAHAYQVTSTYLATVLRSSMTIKIIKLHRLWNAYVINRDFLWAVHENIKVGFLNAHRIGSSNDVDGRKEALHLLH